MITLVASAALADALGVPTYKLMADPLTVPGTSPYRGAISNLGLLVWASAGAVLVLAGLILRRTRPMAHRGQGSFLLVSGLGLLFLGIDDALLLHEDVFSRRYLPIDDRAIYVLYGVGVAIYLRAFASDLLRTDTASLLAATTGLAVSVAMDAFGDIEAAEEHFKYAGLLCLAWWSLDTALRAVSAVVTDGGEAGRVGDGTADVRDPSRRSGSSA